MTPTPMRRAMLALSLAVLPFPIDGSGGFIDVRPTDIDAAAISYVQEQGIMTGQNGRFAPDRPVTRAELAKIAAYANGIVVTDIATAPFPDVPSAHSLAREVAAIAALRLFGNPILRGYPDGLFRPDKATSIAEASKIVLAAASYQPYDGKDYFGVPGLSYHYNLAAQQNLFGRPLSFYAEQKDAPALRRDIARAVHRMHLMREKEVSATLFTCRGPSLWPVQVRENALWSAASGQTSDLCVASDLGIGYRLQGAGLQTYLYVFRTDDRLDARSADGSGMVGGVNLAMHDAFENCFLEQGGGVIVRAQCGDRVRTLNLRTWALGSE